MPLTLVLGPANSAKAGEVLGAYADAARRGALLVVPTREDARHYGAELARDGVVLGSVVTFSGLAYEIGRRVQYAGRRVSELQRGRILERVLVGSRLEVLRESAGAAGFAAAAGELIAELQRSLITPERFSGGLRAWSAQDVRRAPYAREVGRIYADYVRELDRLGRVDRERYAWRVLDALRTEPRRWSGEPVFFYGFDDLTALERDAVETLARVAGAPVTVSLTYEPGREALVARAETVEELRPLAERVLELPAQDEHYAPGSQAVLHHLERHLFATDGAAERLEPGDALTLLEAGGERAEAELVAQQVLQLLRDGMPAEEIVIVYRSRARAAPLLQHVFDQYGIPLAAGYAPPLGHTPLGRGLLGAARCALLPEAEARAQDLLAYLRTPGMLDKPEIADGLDAAIRRRRLRTAAQARAQLGWELAELDSLADAPEPARALCGLARRLFAAPHRGRAPQLSQAQELDARALRALLGAVDELGELGLIPRGAELIELLEGIAVPPRPAASAGGAVLLAEPLEVRARRFRAVFVCGLQEGEFPLPGRPEPFLSDERRWELATAGLRLRPREDALAAERYLFYASVSRATELVALAYRSSDEEGNIALPSPFIDDVAELVAPDWRERRRRRLLADVVWDPALAPTARELARSLAAAQAAVAGEEPAPERALGPGALAEIRHSRILSAGALEAYANCPVRWLIERELQPAPMEPDSDAITRGSLMHDVLERLLRELGEPVSPATLARAQEILDRLLAELALTGAESVAPGGLPVVRAAALRAIEADLRRYLGHEARVDGAWRPQGLELRFGFDDEPDGASLPALELGEGADRVRVRGMIDRLDVDGHGHAVIRDYKSGALRRGWAAANWATERQLQVALYMLVVRELVGLEPVGGFYQPLRGEDLRARGAFLKGTRVGAAVVPNDGREPGELEALLDAAADRAVALAGALRAGRLTPCPQTCSRDGCAFPAICRSQ
ncbi:MAG TPA: PD-(D/E)XK nuclease family protein [Solirubrobacteraceae bacterium]|jgi:superfamily I DNA/RNA helicase/RecB family exonuclease|nr:PD-(D/E)XK nuclease family protein [Solirubrobacteraceae bacterium]